MGGGEGGEEEMKAEEGGTWHCWSRLRDFFEIGIGQGGGEEW